MPWPPMARLVPAYAMGSLSAFWCVERLGQALGQVQWR
jgi:hypothetical protein